ncbi:MAG: VWA domain-containing protein [Phycisphaerae bacterium]
MILANFIFSAPVVLVGCLLAAIPLILHLLGRATATTFEFPTLRFVRAATVKTARRRHIENIMLLLFRMGLFTLLPLALALPFYRSKSVQFGAGKNLALAIVLDNTASMNQQVKNQTAFNLAKQQAIRLLRGTTAMSPPQIAILVCPMDHPPVITSNLTQLSDQIRSLSPTAAETDITQTIRQAQKLLDDQPAPNKLIYVLTDLQKSGFHPDQLKDSKYPLAVLNFHDTYNNLGISEVKLSNPIIAGKPVTLTIQLSGQFTSSRNLSIKLFTENKQLRHKQDILYTDQPIEPIPFDVTIPNPGFFSGYLELTPADQLPIDNRWYFTCKINPPIHALICADSVSPKQWSKDPAFFVSAAVNAPGWIKPKTVKQAKLATENLNNFNVIYLPRSDHLDIDTLEKFLKLENKSVVIFSSLEISCPFIEKMNLGKIISIANSDQPAVIDQTDIADPLIAGLGFKNSAYRQIAVSRYAKLSCDPRTEQLLTLSTGDPLLVKRKIKNSALYFFTSPPQMTYGTLPITAPFPALLAQVAADTISTDASFTFRAGKPFAINADNSTFLTSSQPAIPLKQGQNQLTLFTAGFYKTASGSTLAVNCSEKATDLSAYPISEFSNNAKSPIFAANSPDTLESRLTQLAQGKPLWDYILLTVLIIILAETLLANLRKSAS